MMNSTTRIDIGRGGPDGDQGVHVRRSAPGGGPGRHVEARADGEHHQSAESELDPLRERCIRRPSQHHHGNPDAHADEGAPAPLPCMRALSLFEFAAKFRGCLLDLHRLCFVAGVVDYGDEFIHHQVGSGHRGPSLGEADRCRVHPGLGLQRGLYRGGTGGAGQSADLQQQGTIARGVIMGIHGVVVSYVSTA